MLWFGFLQRAGGTLLSIAVLASVGAMVGTPAGPASAAEPTEVMSQRSEYSRLFANPDGSMTLEVHSRPQRVGRPEGSWVPVDPTLRPRADGTVGPAAAVVDLAFSGGGDGRLARIATDAGALSLSWPEPLPRPVLAGPKATYPDVLPGVDLVLTADVDGFSEVLVVEDREAAANPALDRIALGVETTGWELQPADSGYEVLDHEAGEVVFTIRAPAMWDSSSTAVTLDRTVAPADGDRVSDVGIDLHCPICKGAEPVTSADLTLEPDQAMLDDPSTRFPVYIGPDVAPGRLEWA
jgi:hypothetical protein